MADDGTQKIEKPWYADYKDDGKALAWTDSEFKGVPENLKPRLERINSELTTLQTKTKELAPPEKYELALPEKSLLDGKRKDEIEAFAKAQGLSAKAAQALLQREHETQQQAATLQAQAVETHSKAWLDELKNDKDFGGAKFNETVALSALAVARHGSPELIKFLEETKLGSHPGLVKMLAKVMSLTQDDKAGGGGNAGAKPPAPMTAAQKLYSTIDK